MAGKYNGRDFHKLTTAEALELLDSCHYEGGGYYKSPLYDAGFDSGQHDELLGIVAYNALDEYRAAKGLAK